MIESIITFFKDIETVAFIVKDAAILILIASTLDRIQKGGEERYFRLIFLALLFTI